MVTRGSDPTFSLFSPSVRHKAVSLVSDLEYQNLPKYLKLMTLHSLNQAVHNINTSMADYPGTVTHPQHKFISSAHLVYIFYYKHVT